LSRYKQIARPARCSASRSLGQEKQEKSINAAIIGLGQIGNQFDDDPRRKGIWTHAGAYAAIPEVRLIAGAEPDEGRLQAFLTQRGVPKGYRNYREMLESERIDVLSICSPTAMHHEMVLDSVRAGVKAIFCEKPLATTLEQADEMINACASGRVVLAVNHTRRWDAVYLHARRLLVEGVIGRLESVVGFYPGKLFTMGTHLFDLMRFFAGDAEWVCGHEVGVGSSEPTLSGFIHFRSSVPGAIIAGWERTNHLFELDCLGSAGRLRVSQDGDSLELFRFEQSDRYSGYRELVAVNPDGCRPGLGRRSTNNRMDVLRGSQENRIVAAIRDILRCMGTGSLPACSGEDGRAALEIAWGLYESARKGGLRKDLPMSPSHPTEASLCHSSAGAA
jgi:predicted dehydrogenase